MELKLQLTSETKNTEQLSLTLNQMMSQLPLELRNRFDTVYQGMKACKTKSYKDHDALATQLRVHGVSYKTKIVRKPVPAFYILVCESV